MVGHYSPEAPLGIKANDTSTLPDLSSRAMLTGDNLLNLARFGVSTGAGVFLASKKPRLSLGVSEGSRGCFVL